MSAQARKQRGRRLRAVATYVEVLVVLAAVAAGGAWLGGHPQHLPKFLREALVSSQANGPTAEALSLIEHDYLHPVRPSPLIAGSISGALQTLHDPFSHYLSPAEYKQFASPGSFSGVGLEAVGTPQGLLIERVFSSSPAQRAGLKPGELIVAVNGRSLAGLPAEAARNLVRGPAGTPVTLTVRSGKTQRTLTLTRAVVDEPAVFEQLKQVGAKRVGYIYLASFSDGCAQEVKEALQKLKAQGAQGYLLDLRHDGGGLVREAQLIASLFLPKGDLVVTMRSRIAPTLVLRAVGGAIAPSGPMAVLVDRDTASAAEILTGALQDNRRAVVVGTHTFGKGVFQELFTLSNGGALDLTVGEYFTPNGRNLGGGGVREGAGIPPEVELPLAVADSPSGVERALALVAAGR